MNRMDCHSPVRDQAAGLKALSPVLAERYFDLSRLDAALGEAAKTAKRVIFTGAGGSYSAVGAMLPGFKALSGLAKCNTPDLMDFCRFYSPLRIAKGYDMGEVLLVTISTSGATNKVAEAMEKARGLGCATLLITNVPDSPCGRAADHVLPLDIEGDGAISYYATLTALTALGAYIGLKQGHITEGRFAEVKAAVAAHTAAFMDTFDAVDELMFAQALRMKELTHFEVIADWNEGWSGQFIEQAFIELGGVYCDHITAEEFSHISYFVRSPQTYGTLVLVNRADPTLSRMKDTLWGCLAQHRPTVVVTDGDEADFYNDREVWDPLREGMDKPVLCPVPTPPEQWMSPLVDFIPGALLAGYHAALNSQEGDEDHA